MPNHTLRQDLQRQDLQRQDRPAVLCIAPPYPAVCPPGGAASLLGYLKAHGCQDFDFLDLRLGVPNAYGVTYTNTGAFGEAFVMDVPDLPLVLALLDSWRDGTFATFLKGELFATYCFERCISPHSLASYLVSMECYLEQRLTPLAADFIGFTVWTSNFLSTLMACAVIRRRRKPTFITLGGPQVSESRASSALALQSGLADAVVAGEGEATLLDLYDAYSAGRATDEVPGTRTLDASSGTIRETPRSLLSLQDLEAPDFSQMALESYQRDDYRTVPFQLSRGCTDKCSFCSEWVFWGRYRIDSVDHAIDQIGELKRKYQPDFISFTDSLLNGSPKRLAKMVSALIEDGDAPAWGGFMRAEMDAEMAGLLRQAKCEEVFVGVESFDDVTLSSMNKRRTENDNIRSLRAFLEAGIHVNAGLIPGFPGDSRRAFLHSAQQMRKLQSEYPGKLQVSIEPFAVSPNQPLFKRLAEVGLKPHRWAEEYLEIHKDSSSITEGIWCWVEGEEQGAERQGRYRIATSLCWDETADHGVVEYDEQESLREGSFYFEHIDRGLWLAKTKSEGRSYVLIATEREKALIESACGEGGVVTDREELDRLLPRIERSHLLPPRRRPENAKRSSYTARIRRDSTLAISPYAVARTAGSGRSLELWATDAANLRTFRLPRAAIGLLEQLIPSPKPLREIIEKAPRQARQTRSVVKSLAERGVLHVYG